MALCVEVILYQKHVALNNWFIRVSWLLGLAKERKVEIATLIQRFKLQLHNGLISLSR